VPTRRDTKQPNGTRCVPRRTERSTVAVAVTTTYYQTINGKQCLLVEAIFMLRYAYQETDNLCWKKKEDGRIDQRIELTTRTNYVI